MEKQQDPAVVQAQYQTAQNLQVRIRLHEKYSVNRQSFGDWIFSQYAFPHRARILEVGCGDGSMWEKHAAHLPQDARLLLTDFSQGMLEEAKTHAIDPRISFAQADVQQLPYADEAFDAVIAHMMLYHVPDIHQGISELHRVLKKGGVCYCATYGENGITSYLQKLLAGYGVSREMNKRFTLQNGGEMLKKHFAQVVMHERKDALHITDCEDLLDYIFSMTAMMGAAHAEKGQIRRLLQMRMENGAIHIPKEYGMFICRK